MTIRTTPKKYLSSSSSQRCKVCSHVQQGKINEEILSGRPRKEICKEYGMSPGALSNHINNHLPDIIVQAEREKAKQKKLKNDAEDTTLSIIEDRRLIFGRKASRELDQFREVVGVVVASSFKNYREKHAREDGSLVIAGAKDWAFLTGLQSKIVDRMYEIDMEDARSSFDIFNCPEIQQFLGLLFTALAPFPDARKSVAKTVLEFRKNDYKLPGESGEVIDV